ncbi:hypothetical protein [Streptomyces inhibens]|uniref:hypothetical protein n=1 Tax=Streptomyces inhibens TaxID=2293571 RepID=UPI001FD34E89|nr:hypothetical protein [Streptomyces inhibens]
MTKRILVTGVGGAPGFDLARSLIRLGCRVITADADPYAPGLLLPETTPHVTVPATDLGYRAGMLRLCAKARPDAVLSTVERELPQLLSLRRPLADLGVTTWLPDPPAVEACGDKARFATVLTERGIPTPRTVLPHEIDQAPDGLLSSSRGTSRARAACTSAARGSRPASCASSSRNRSSRSTLAAGSSPRTASSIAPAMRR